LRKRCGPPRSCLQTRATREYTACEQVQASCNTLCQQNMQIHCLQTTGPTHSVPIQDTNTLPTNNRSKHSVPVKDTSTLPANNRSNTHCVNTRYKYAAYKQQVQHTLCQYKIQIRCLQTTGPTHSVPVKDTNTLPANNRSNTLCASKRYKCTA